MIRLEHLTLAHGSRTLIDDASVTFHKGSLTALIGRNGSGKSTLLRNMAGLSKNYSGRISVDDRPLARMTTGELARTVATVTTERLRIAGLRCRDVVALGRSPYTDWLGRLSPDDRRIVDETISLVGMSEYSDRTMDTMSDGECQRIMIARAVAQATPAILLDEPTSFLDLPNRYGLCSLLSRLAHDRGKCIIFSTHELDIAMHTADTIALIDNCRIHMHPTTDPETGRLIKERFAIPQK